MTENKESYELSVYCKNCDFKSKIEIPKGVVVEEHLCPNCDTLNLQKDYNADGGTQSVYNFE